jgi:cyclopropane-fatty-acyl-phospholipid synthase
MHRQKQKSMGVRFDEEHPPQAGGAKSPVGPRPCPPRAAAPPDGAGARMLLLQGLFQMFVRNGSLILIGPDGRTYRAGGGAPSVTIRIKDPGAIPSILLDFELAIGEAYMDGAFVVEEGDIYDFLALCLRNVSALGRYWPVSAISRFRRLCKRLIQYNPVGVSHRNVAHHYDLSDTLYDLFLDPDRQYSCAYYRSPDETLEQAQTQKKRHLAAKLLLRPGQKLLDIGSGWGGLALYLAEAEGVHVTGITLSAEQYRYAQRRAQALGKEEQVEFRIADYRHEANRYDRIVSVGMFEHVGIGHYQEYFRKIHALLEDNGIALVHTIGLAGAPGAANPWLDKYIFPGGYCPALSEILPAIEKAGLYVTDIEVLRLHYAETLRAWRQRFLENRARIALLYDERFCRMWEFYLAGCEAGFRHGYLVNFQIQLSRRHDAVPLTRDYIAIEEARLGARDSPTRPSFMPAGERVEERAA